MIQHENIRRISAHKHRIQLLVDLIIVIFNVTVAVVKTIGIFCLDHDLRVSAVIERDCIL